VPIAGHASRAPWRAELIADRRESRPDASAHRGEARAARPATLTTGIKDAAATPRPPTGTDCDARVAARVGRAAAGGPTPHVRDVDRNAHPVGEVIQMPSAVGTRRMIGERRCRSAFSSSSAAMPRRWTR
jgi:hypothetical protein